MRNLRFNFRVDQTWMDNVGLMVDQINNQTLIGMKARREGRPEINRADLIHIALAYAWNIQEPDSLNYHTSVSKLGNLRVDEVVKKVNHDLRPPALRAASIMANAEKIASEDESTAEIIVMSEWKGKAS